MAIALGRGLKVDHGSGIRAAGFGSLVLAQQTCPVNMAAAPPLVAVADYCWRRQVGSGFMGTKKYDLVVIGSGPAGEKGAAQAAYFGKKVALVEKEDVLGAAANTGTLPSKTLRESALYLSGFRQRGLYGINFELKDKVTARDFLYRERLVVQSERARIAENVKRHDIGSTGAWPRLSMLTRFRSRQETGRLSTWRATCF
jgi:hypothetical protein